MGSSRLKCQLGASGARWSSASFPVCTGMVWSGVVVLYGMLLCCMVLYCVILYVLCVMVVFVVVLYGMLLCCRVLYSVVWYCIALYGMGGFWARGKSAQKKSSWA